MNFCDYTFPFPQMLSGLQICVTDVVAGMRYEMRFCSLACHAYLCLNMCVHIRAVIIAPVSMEVKWLKMYS